MPPPNILIVEDEKVLANNIKEFLDHRAPNVRIVADGEHALELLKTFTPDAIVMDYRLPGMNGIDTYSEIVRRNAKPIDCVMITGDPIENLRQTATDCGIRSVLAKPFSFAELLKRLEPGPAPDEARETEPPTAAGEK